ncbi:MAG TPA: hypothetical protein VIU61_04955, partial [Kofleriaceae bacterium]
PETLAGYVDWKGKRVVVFGHDSDSLQWVVRAAYADAADDDELVDPELPSDAMWRAFNADLDRWLLGVHAKQPIALFVKPIDEEYSTETNEWHDWTCERIPVDVLPIVNELGKAHEGVASYAAGSWRAWVEDQPYERQVELVATLTDEARAELKRRKVLFEPAPPAPVTVVEPSLDEAEAIWRACAGELEPSPHGLRLEDAFTIALRDRGFDPDYTLLGHLALLGRAKRHREVVELASLVLETGAEFPSHWAPDLVTANLALGDLDAAARAMPAVADTLESYSPEMLRTAMRYHARADEREDEALLFHAGLAWFTTFSSGQSKSATKKYGAAPADLGARFAAWFARWLEGTPHWDLSRLTRIGHWLVWFDKLGVKDTERVAPFIVERDRRSKLRADLEVAPDEQAARALVDQLAGVHEVDDVHWVFRKLFGRLPVAAYHLLCDAIARENRVGYRGNLDAETFVTFIHIVMTTPALADRLEDTFRIVRGWRLQRHANLHHNIACLANRLGHREAALEHVASALREGHADPNQLHDDADLRTLHGDPAFEQLFAADAARRAAANAPKPRAPKKKKPKKAAKKRAKSRPAKKTPARKQPAKKQPPKKQPAKKQAKKPTKRR